MPTDQSQVSHQPAMSSCEAPPQLDIATRFGEAVTLHQAGKLAEAREAYIAILAREPGNLATLNNLALISPPDIAESCLRQALTLKSDYGDALVNLANLLQGHGKHSEAAQLYQRALQADPSDERAADGLVRTREALNGMPSQTGDALFHASTPPLPSPTADTQGLNPASAAAMTQPFFSVIVPTHLRAPLLRRALQSIKSQASSVTCEVLVISDAIDPATDAVCTELLTSTDMYIRRNGAAGPAASRNLALTLAQGRYVLFLDDDDAWHPAYLEQLHAEPAVRQGLPVYCNCTVVTERRPREGPEELSEASLDLADRLTKAVYIKNQVHMSCFAFPRELLTDITFDTSMRAYEDWDFLLSVFDRRRPLHVPIFGSRVHEVHDETTDRRGSNKQATDFNAVLDYLYVYRRHPAGSSDLKQRRSELLLAHGLSIPPETL